MGRSLLTLVLPSSTQLLKLFLEAPNGVLDLCASLGRVLRGTFERHKADTLDVKFFLDGASLVLVLVLAQPGGRWR